MTDDTNDGAPKKPAAKAAAKPTTRRKTTSRTPASRAASAKPASSKSTPAKSRPAKSPSAKPAAAKAAPAKPAAAKPAAAKSAAAKPAAAKSQAKTASAKPAAAKPATNKPSASATKAADAKAPAKSVAATKPSTSRTPKPAAAKAQTKTEAQTAAKPAAKKAAPVKPEAANASKAKTAAPEASAPKAAASKAAEPKAGSTASAGAVHGTITGPLVMIGLGSIGKGTLPLIERHFKFDKSRFTVIDPVDGDAKLVTDRGYRFEKVALTPENYKDILTPLLTEGEGQGFVVNLSVDTSSLDLMKFCRKLGVLYIDTVVEPWPGFYFDDTATAADRTNYALREAVRREKKKHPGGTTAVSCCGANPGMVSWFVKKALVDIATDTGVKFKEPSSQKGWAKLMKKVGVKGIHIAERDTQRAKEPKPFGEFWNTWSVEGFLSEGFQPAELGWGTHETWKPANAKKHKKGCKAAIYLEQPGANTRVRTWCPTPGAQYGFLSRTMKQSPSPTTSP